MNKDRREQITAAAALVGEASAKIAEASAAVESVRDEESEYLDAMPEGFKNGDRGQAAEAAVSAMDDALNELQQIGTAEIIRSLEEAGDLSLKVDTVEPKITSKEAEKRRWERLPQWAKDRIARLEADVETLKASAATPFPEPTGAVNEIVFHDYMDGPLAGKALPLERVEFPAHGVRIEADGRGVLIRASDGMIIVRPCASNEVIVKAVPFA